MGKMSRNKGRRLEQQLVLYLKQYGWKAERILRQCQEAGQPDVVATHNDRTYTFESKGRRCSFKTIYELYYAEQDDKGLLGFVLEPHGTAVLMSTNWPALEKHGREGVTLRDLSKRFTDPKKLKVYARIVKLQELKQSADYLVLKDDGKPQLFVRYWG